MANNKSNSRARKPGKKTIGQTAKNRGGGKGHNGGGATPRLIPERDTEIVKQAITANGGIMTHTAKSLGVGKTTLQKFINADPDLLAHLADQREVKLDVAEGNIMAALYDREPDPNKKAEAGQPAPTRPTKIAVHTSRWVLETMGESRGYSRRVNVAGPGGGAIPVDIGSATINLDDFTAQEKRALARAMRKASADGGKKS